MKKTKLYLLIFSCLMSVVLLSGVLVACGEEETAAPAATTAAPAATTPAEEDYEPIELIFHHLNPETATVCQAAKAWGDKITEETGGKVTFVHYWAGTLIPPGETLKSMQAGVADVAFFPPDANFQPMSYGILLPFVGVPSMQAGNEMIATLVDEFPAIGEEYPGLNLYAPRMTAMAHIHTSKKAVTLPEDLVGVKVRVAMDNAIVRFVEAAGGAAVEVVPPELPMALEKGVIDGVYFSFTALNGFGCVPAMPYHTIFGEGGVAGDLDFLAIRTETFNSLPGSVQEIILDSIPWYSDQMLKAEEDSLADAIGIAEEMGHTFVNLTDEQIAVWADLVGPIHQDWIAAREAEGKPGQALYDRIKELVAGYQ